MSPNRNDLLSWNMNNASVWTFYCDLRLQIWAGYERSVQRHIAFQIKAAIKNLILKYLVCFIDFY